MCSTRCQSCPVCVFFTCICYLSPPTASVSSKPAQQRTLFVLRNSHQDTISSCTCCCADGFIWWMMMWDNTCDQISPGEVVSSIFQPVVLKDVLHTLPPDGQDGQPCQHGPKPVLLSNVVSTLKRECNGVCHAQRRSQQIQLRTINITSSLFQLKRGIFWCNSLLKGYSTCTKAFLPTQRQPACVH